MIWRKIAVFVALLSLCANLAIIAYGKSIINSDYYSTKNELNICENIGGTTPLEYILVQTSKTRWNPIVLYYESENEIKSAMPENYKCVVVQPKHRVQEARRIVEEDLCPNICSKSC